MSFQSSQKSDSFRRASNQSESGGGDELEGTVDWELSVASKADWPSMRNNLNQNKDRNMTIKV